MILHIMLAAVRQLSFQSTRIFMFSYQIYLSRLSSFQVNQDFPWWQLFELCYLKFWILLKWPLYFLSLFFLKSLFGRCFGLVLIIEWLFSHWWLGSLHLIIGWLCTLFLLGLAQQVLDVLVWVVCNQWHQVSQIFRWQQTILFFML